MLRHILSVLMRYFLRQNDKAIPCLPGYSGRTILFYMIAILSILFFSYTTCYSQEEKITQFSQDSMKFITQLESYMVTGVAEKSNVKEYLARFSAVWHSSGYNENYKNATYHFANEMLTARVQVYPTFQSFLNAMMHFVQSGMSQQVFAGWSPCLEKLMKKRTMADCNKYLEISDELFGSKIIFQSPTYTWNVDNYDFSFRCDSTAEIHFSKINLKCTNQGKDTILIYNTGGTYFPLKSVFKGNGGRVNWIRTGLSPDSVYADIRNYSIVLKQGGWIIDSVTFWNKTYFDKPLEGRVMDKDLSEAKGNETFPRFISYGKRFVIPGLTSDVSYDGGFSMQGKKFVGSGTTEQPAKLIFKRNDKPFLEVSSLVFGITKDGIKTDDARILFHIGEDSICHPDVQMEYNIKRRKVALIRSDLGLSQSPFSDSYHKVNMFFEVLSWDFSKPILEFHPLQGSSQDIADFESQDFFRPQLYEGLKEGGGNSPLTDIVKYVKMSSNKEFYVKNLAEFLHTTINEEQPIITKLAVVGLVDYDLQSDKVKVLDRLYRYINNMAGKTDYDVVDYHSVSPGRDTANHDSIHSDNGIMNLNTNNITINGVRVVVLSDSQHVYIFPKNHTVTLHKNRDVNFAGNVHAGRFDFFGKDFYFDYNAFNIKMKHVDSLRLMANAFPNDSLNLNHLVIVKSVIRNLSGNLLIDKPVNRSGIKPFHEFPIIISDTNTYVYYDKKSIQGGCYKKENFYFNANPFTIDSLERFSNVGLKFSGVLLSAGIFPELKDTLKLQPDYSLGFIHRTDDNGIDLYGGKGTFVNEINLSNKGLIGDGKIKYLSSVSSSPQFTFLPDSTNGTASDFAIAEQASPPENPDVKGKNVYEHWIPKNDMMFINDLTEPFNCYHDRVTFHGMLHLSPDTLKGGGEIDFPNALLASKVFKFTKQKFDADSTSFSLKTNDFSGVSFATDNMKGDVDFSTEIGDFKSNGNGSTVKFPINKYIAFMDEFKWFITQKEIELGSSQKTVVSGNGQELNFTGSMFISVAPGQDSLQFISPKARFNIENNIIRAHEVPYIDVADAQITPDSGNITVRKDAEMDPFTNAHILANKVTKYYSLYKANLTITSRKNYSGSGYCDYVDEGKMKKPLYFGNIHVDTSHQTVADGEIKDSANFALSPHFKFKGNVILKARNPFFFFDGICKIHHECDEVKISEFGISSEVDPDNIAITIYHPVSQNNIPLAATPVLTTADSVHFYPAFLSPLINTKKDFEIVSDSGLLTYDNASKEYRISTKEKLVEQSLPGNYISLDTRKCILYAEGAMNLGTDYGMVDTKIAGDITDYIIPDSVTVDMMALLKFPFADDALDKMAVAAQSSAFLTPVDFNTADFRKNLKELIGVAAADKIISQLSLYGTLKKFPDELESALFITNVSLKWDPATKSYLSRGSIGIGSIGRNVVYKRADGVVEFRKKRGGDELNIYIQFDGTHWYFFTYKNGYMESISSVAGFNDAITSLKSNKREFKSDKGSYNFNIALETARTLFFKRLEASQN